MVFPVPQQPGVLGVQRTPGPPLNHNNEPRGRWLNYMELFSFKIIICYLKIEIYYILLIIIN